jgi:hypothetical protein
MKILSTSDRTRPAGDGARIMSTAGTCASIPFAA